MAKDQNERPDEMTGEIELVDEIEVKDDVRKSSKTVKAKGKKGKDKKKVNIFVRIIKAIGKFFRETKSEIKKVVWPSKKQVLNNAIIVFIFLAISAVFVGGVDLILNKIVQLVFKLAS